MSLRALVLPMGTRESLGNIFSIIFNLKKSFNNRGLRCSPNKASSFIDLKRMVKSFFSAFCEFQRSEY